MSEVQVALDVRARLGECPRWDEKSQCLYWIDIDSFRLHRFDPRTHTDDIRQFDQEIGCFSLRDDGGFVLAMRSGFYFIDSWDAPLRPICDPEADLPDNRFNDGRCDAAGRLLAGTMDKSKTGGASLYSLDPALTVRRLEDGVNTANGLAFSPDNTRMYFSDTPRHVIYVYDYDISTGAASNRRVFHQFPHGHGRPDGAAVDSEGYYWSALYEGGRVVRLNPAGEIVQEIAVPARCPTMVAFGGADLKTLYITSVGQRPEAELADYPLSGALFSVAVEVAGQVEPRFRITPQ
ncbi:SMP-30/gluconolactonase/LRE family protein [Pokkaliibacter sp. MBI-7]|uniref:SMP-30/gluconolactonase/LRE family protein n=1 Tax=Pokkaliibacter sp. MBI-7 TaxID=3040600 RepID=UPI0024481D18|nr:SMP-30/gluconolactonase/LRE family protein [Pokkaliibacter sp. MBI-7]MDH2433815.1 SMP-30/gluconolactonase/LRE family protein [Pokkaliibacter sp. MBI-7]